MDRRKYLKTLAVGTLGATTLLQSCDTDKKPDGNQVDPTFTIDRTPQELAREKKLLSETFFDEHEMSTLTHLADMIIPKDDRSGSASDAGVPAFIEFIVKDMPQHQIPMRGGLKWLDVQCMKRFNADFLSCSAAQQTEMIDEIAYPEKTKPELEQGVAFFNKMRDLTATGFFTSEIGIKDLEYLGNAPNQWDGVPQDVLTQYGLKYDEKTLAESVKYT